MGRSIGIISLLVVLGVALLIILGIWGIVPFDIRTLGKAAITGIVLFITFGLVFGIYGMFFWNRGANDREKTLPSSSKEKLAQRKQDSI